MSKENSKIVSLKTKATELIAEILEEKLDDLTQSKLENILNLILSDKKVDYEEAKKYFNTKFKNMKNTKAVDLLDTIRDYNNYNRQIVIEKDSILKNLVQSQVDIDKTIKRIDEKNKNEKQFVVRKKIEDKTFIENNTLDKISKIITELEENTDHEKIKKEFTTLQDDIVNKTKEMRKNAKLIKYEEIRKRFLEIYKQINKIAAKEKIDTKDINIKLNEIKDLLSQFEKEIKVFNEESLEIERKENKLKEKARQEAEIKKIDEREKARDKKAEEIEKKFKEKEQKELKEATKENMKAVLREMEARHKKKEEKYLENIMSIVTDKKIVEKQNDILDNIKKITDTNLLDKLINLFQDIKLENRRLSTKEAFYEKFMQGFGDASKEVRNKIIDEFLEQLEKQSKTNKEAKEQKEKLIEEQEELENDKNRILNSLNSTTNDFKLQSLKKFFESAKKGERFVNKEIPITYLYFIEGKKFKKMSKDERNSILDQFVQAIDKQKNTPTNSDSEASNSKKKNKKKK